MKHAVSVGNYSDDLAQRSTSAKVGRRSVCSCTKASKVHLKASNTQCGEGKEVLATLARLLPNAAQRKIMETPALPKPGNSVTSSALSLEIMFLG